MLANIHEREQKISVVEKRNESVFMYSPWPRYILYVSTYPSTYIYCSCKFSVKNFSI